MGYRRRSQWSLAGRLAPVLLLFAVAAPRASAACGDHVQIIPATAAVHANPPIDEPVAPAPRPPCGGRKCDQAPPDRTPPAPPTVTTDGPQHDAALIAVSPTESLAVAAHATDNGGSPRNHVASIFHPPRP